MLRKFAGDRRGSIALLSAVILPACIMSVGIAVEVTRWTTVTAQLQRTADIAALAGGTQYALSPDAQAAANAAADLAELNGSTGTANRTWSAGSQTLSDNGITVQLGPSVRNANNVGLQVTVTQTVPLVITKFITALSAVTLRASGWVEVAVEPCVLALNPNGSGITAQGNVSVTLTNCSARSNAAISTIGGAQISASALYAGASISGNVTGVQYPNDGAIADPYAHYAPVQSAFAHLAVGSGIAFSDKASATDALMPGIYSSWNINGSVTLSQGIYYVNGAISLGSQASLSGNGVTIVTSGGFTIAGGAALNLAAATIASTNGAIPGIVIADASTSSMSFAGNSAPVMSGMVYAPYADVVFKGTATGGSSGCLKVIAQSVSVQGNSGLATNCAAYGTPLFSSDSMAPVALVQ